MLYRFKYLAFVVILFALLAAGRPAIASAQTGDTATVPRPSNTTGSVPDFTNTTDPLIQQHELAAYVRSNGLRASLVQVDLATLPKLSQYADIDTSSTAYGYNTCGPIAAAVALGGEDWPRLLSAIAAAAGQDYSPSAGIQPSRYVAALQKVFGNEKVAAINAGTLGDIYRALSEGKIVISDIQVNALTELPTVEDPNYAHFGRILGINVSKHEIYIQNTLSGSAYWTLSLTNFVRVWDNPETAVSIIPDPQHAEAVTRWMVTLDSNSIGA